MTAEAPSPLPYLRGRDQIHDLVDRKQPIPHLRFPDGGGAWNRLPSRRLCGSWLMTRDPGAPHRPWSPGDIRTFLFSYMPGYTRFTKEHRGTRKCRISRRHLCEFF
jgi:hypothetical protein